MTQDRFCFDCHGPSQAHEPLRAWVYPCNCLVVAHDFCFSWWTTLCQESGTLECPQCKTIYEPVNNSLRIIFPVLGLLNRASRFFTLVYVPALATTHGKWALKQFVGPGMQALLLPDDFTMRWTTFIALPSIPLTLILNRFSTQRLIPFITSVFLLRPPTSTGLRSFLPWSDTPWSWSQAPIPAISGFIFATSARYLYRKVWTCLQVHVLGYVPPSMCDVGDTIMWNDWPVQIRRKISNDAVQGGQGQIQTIKIRRPSLGRHIFSALIVPWISNVMGTFLLAQSKHSTILRRILAVEPQTDGLLGLLQKMLGVVWQSDMTGSSMWSDTDPVWWRNMLGLGLFVVVKDAMELLHLVHWDERVVVV